VAASIVSFRSPQTSSGLPAHSPARLVVAQSRTAAASAARRSRA
jgi:hypothetical protein